MRTPVTVAPRKRHQDLEGCPGQRQEGIYIRHGYIICPPWIYPKRSEATSGILTPMQAFLTRREALGAFGFGALAMTAKAEPQFPQGAIIRSLLKDHKPEELAGGSTLFTSTCRLCPTSCLAGTRPPAPRPSREILLWPTPQRLQPRPRRLQARSTLWKTWT